VPNPTNTQSWNKYSYGLNDPINFIDPSGLEIQDAGSGCTWDTDTNTLTCPPDPLAEQQKRAALQQLNGGSGTDGSNTGGNATPQTGSLIGIRTPGQTFSQCMRDNANYYSIGGALELGANWLTGTNTSFSSTFLGGLLGGNSVSSLLVGTNADVATTVYNTAGTDIATAAMGTSLTYGRRTAAIMSLNLVGTPGRAPGALRMATSGTKSFLGTLSKITNAGLELSEKVTVDAAFTLGESISCSFPR
jgi:hypothetical protein